MVQKCINQTDYEFVSGLICCFIVYKWKRKDREILDNSFITSIFVSSKKYRMAIKNFKTKEEALAAMKKATDRKRTLIE